jgi:hypothetical protein
MNNVQIKDNFEPYVRVFEQRWNAHLERENKMFAEVFSRPVDGMICVAFYAVDRQKFPTRMKIIDDSFEPLKKQFPKIAWSQLNNGYPFIDMLNNVIVIIKPNIRYHWGEQTGCEDADETIGRNFVATMPDEWKQLN